MNTFLPYPDFIESANCLDNKRLGKQRVECLQLLNTLHGFSVAWTNHPCTLMWLNNKQALVYYGLCVCDAWVYRGFKDTCKGKIEQYRTYRELGHLAMPYWFGDNRLHSSHRSNLLRKDPEWYGKYLWTEKNNIPYYWPK